MRWTSLKCIRDDSKENLLDTKSNTCGLVLCKLREKNVNGIERPITVVHETPCGNKPEIPLEIIVGVILEDELNLNVVRSAVSRYSSHKLLISASCILRQTECLSEAADKQPAKDFGMGLCIGERRDVFGTVPVAEQSTGLDKLLHGW
jgi:hypothetical protein